MQGVDIIQSIEEAPRDADILLQLNSSFCCAWLVRRLMKLKVSVREIAVEGFEGGEAEKQRYIQLEEERERVRVRQE